MIVGAIALIEMSTLGYTANADQLSDGDDALPRSTFGYVGIIEMPSAEMAPDGQISATPTYFRNTLRFNFDFQALPWLDTEFRYTALYHFEGANPEYHHGFGLKLRLFQEGDYLPAIVVGERDLFGTGIYSSEYLAVSKHIFDDFDITAGMGWGRLATAGTIPSPLGFAIPSLDYRPPIGTGVIGVTGEPDSSQLFHGSNAGIFGGIVWQTPIKDLALVAEYSSDRYLAETEFGNFSPRSQLNYGLNYRVFDTAQIGLFWLYDRALAVNFSLQADPTTNAFPSHIAPVLPDTHIRPASQQREALERLLNGTKSSEPSNRSAARTRNEMLGRSHSIASFADHIMVDDNGVLDVRLQGTTVFIVADATKISADKCRVYAEFAGAMHTDLTTINLVGSNTRRNRAVACAVPSDLEFFPATATPANFAAPSPHAEQSGSFVSIGTDGTTHTLGSSAPKDRLDKVFVENKIRADITLQDLKVEALHLGASEVVVYFSNTRYWSETEAVGRIVRVLMADAPPDVEYFRLVSLEAGVPLQQYRILRTPIERMLAEEGSAFDDPDAITLSRPPLDTPLLTQQADPTYPRFNWSIFPFLKENFFDPSNPAQFGLSAGASGQVEFLPGLALNGEIDGSVWNDFDVNQVSNSVLPHVRSDFAQYIKYGADGIGNLSGSYEFRLAPSVIGLAKVGILEDMFGGAGGEVLWEPENSRFAFGIDAYEVWQRNFDRLFGFMPYHVLTGHIAIYYQSPWYNLNFRVLAGRYLAGDHGATFEITRRFSTGVEIGGFFTLTNVSAAQYGEGSFDKGIIIRIPLEWGLPLSTQTEFDMDLRPTTRDGGQRLNGDTTLYDSTLPLTSGEIKRDVESVIEP